MKTTLVQCLRRGLLALPLPLVMLVHAPAAWADRPFVNITSAAAEDDDDNVWSVQTWAGRTGSVRELNVAVEYAFNPFLSMQVTGSRAKFGAAGADPSGRLTGQEIELKYLFNNINRDGWGVGVQLAYERVRAKWSDGVSANTSATSWVVPFSKILGDKAALVHLNLGLEKPKGLKAERVISVGLEGEVARRVTLFGEYGRLGDTNLASAGVRWWIKREKLALDVSAQQWRSDGARESGWQLGLSFYDL